MANSFPVDTAGVGQPTSPTHPASPPALRLALDEPTESYRSVSVLAVCGLLFGLASILAWTHPLLWSIPLVGLVICALALRKLAHDAPNLVGWKAAWLGLALSLVLGSAAITRWTVHHFLVEREAVRVGEMWLEDLRAGKTYAAHQLTLVPMGRLATGSSLPAGYDDAPQLLAQYQEFVDSSLVKAIRRIPGQPQFRLYEINKYQSAHDRDRIEAVYAVTYEMDGKRRTFFVQMILHRLVNRSDGKAGWQIVPINNAYRPAA